MRTADTAATAWFPPGEIRERDTRGGDRVPGGNLARGSFDGYEAISDTSADILSDLGLKIAIQRVFAAPK